MDVTVNKPVMSESGILPVRTPEGIDVISMNFLPITGIVMVSTPQDMVSMIVGKAINMARKLNINIIGLIENMSYIVCPGCSEKIKIFESDSIYGFLDKNRR